MTRKTFVILSVLMISARVWAAPVSVLPVNGTNMSAGEAEAIAELFVGAYAAETLAPVSGPKNVPAGLDAQETIEINAIRLDQRISLRAVLRGQNGEVLYQATLTATSMDDMDLVIPRLAKSLAKRIAPEATQTIHTVTQTEAKPENKIGTEKVMGLKTALVIPMAKGIEFEPALTLQFDGRFEFEKGFFEIGAGAQLPTGGEGKKGIGGVFAELGGSLYLADDSMSPYVGAGVVPRIFVSGDDDGGMRAGVYGQAGLMMLRESSTRMYVELRVTQEAIGYEKQVRVYDLYGSSTESSDERYYPTEVGLQFGIGW